MSISPCPATTPPTIDGGLAGRDQSDEGAGLEEREHGDEQIGPLAERTGDVLEHLLGLRAANSNAPAA